MVQSASMTEDFTRENNVPETVQIGVTTGSGAPSFGDAVYVTSGGLATQAKADSSSTMPAIGLYAGNNRVQFLGVFTKHDWNWTPGGAVWVSDSTAGALTQTMPTSSGHFEQAIGVALSATTVLITNGYFIAHA